MNSIKVKNGYYIYELYQFIFLKTFGTEFLYIDVRFTDKNSNLLEMEDKTNISLVSN